jgi:hypothetical protein
VLSAHFEQVREISAEAQRHAHAQRVVAEVSDQQALVTGAVPEKSHPVQVDLLPAKGHDISDQ